MAHLPDLLKRRFHALISMQVVLQTARHPRSNAVAGTSSGTPNHPQAWGFRETFQAIDDRRDFRFQ